MKQSVRFAFILIGVLFACCFALNAQEEQKPATKPEPKLTNWYKVDISLSEFDEGKKTNTRSFAANVEENGAVSVVKLGDRVPVMTGTFSPSDKLQQVTTQFQYVDVGLNISCYVRERQGRLGVTVALEQSSVTFADKDVLRTAPNQPVIRQMKMENTAFVTLGKPILIASVDDPGKVNHKYTVEATVTKLNP